MTTEKDITRNRITLVTCVTIIVVGIVLGIIFTSRLEGDLQASCLIANWSELPTGVEYSIDILDAHDMNMAPEILDCEFKFKGSIPLVAILGMGGNN